MIKIDRTQEVGKSKIDNPFNDIKASESSDISKQELSDLVLNEFQKAHNEAGFDEYDDLLSEIYGRSEEELNIDFPISQELKDALKEFQLSEWLTENKEEHLDVIEKLVNTLSKELGLEEAPKVLLFFEPSGNYGVYDYENNTIELNRFHFLNPKDVVNTISHEMRHAYQYMRAEKLETKEDALFKVNLENYIEPKQLADGSWINFYEYQNQYVEVDARVFADKITEAMK